MPEKFYNPYQFVAVDTRNTPVTSYLDRDSLDIAANRFVRHDYWTTEGYSGRINCTLTSRSPVVTGASQCPGDRGKNKSGVVHQFRDHHDNAAIPGSSLRGMIGSVAETISQSAMRVLASEANGAYSVRKSADPKDSQPLKDIGLVYRRNGQCYILPLGNQVAPQNRGEYYPEKIRANSSLARFNDEIDGANCYQHELEDHREQYQGIYYIRGKMTGMQNKRREVFFSTTQVDLEDTSMMFKVDDKAIETLENILRIRYKDETRSKSHNELQLLPKGYMQHEARDWKLGSTGHLLLHGDMIYYRTEPNEDSIRVVVELSYSSIWRLAVHGDLHNAFGRQCGPNSLPWYARRDSLTPAEALLGVVENEPSQDRPARNLASRVRFTDATANSPVKQLPEITLKALSAPKPPSPALYFGDKNGYLKKAELDLSGDNPHQPNGRKHYLPHPESLDPNAPPRWTTGNHNRAHLKLKCQPIDRDQVFHFQVMFENLSPDELTLLRRALQPGEQRTFLHRIGLGKSLGLGHVSIDSADVELINRATRYSAESLIADLPRYLPADPEADNRLIDQTALNQLQAIAATDKPCTTVCFPFSEPDSQSSYSEEDGYKWFGRNDRVGKNVRRQHMHRKTGSTEGPMEPLDGG